MVPETKTIYFYFRFNFHSSIVTYSKLLALHGREHMVDGFTTTCAKVANTTNIVSLNPTHSEVYSIQHYVIKYVSDFWQAGQWFSPGTPVSSTNKTDRHNIAEILLKVALNTIHLDINTWFQLYFYGWPALTFVCIK